MKEIILEGRKRGLIKLTCPVCGCRFKTDEYQQVTIDNGQEYVFDDCPSCGYQCIVSVKDCSDKEGKE